MAIKMIKIYSELKRISIPLPLVETLPFSRKSEQCGVHAYEQGPHQERSRGWVVVS